MIQANSHPVIVIGAGGHAKVVIDTLRQMNQSILGLVDPCMKQGELVHGVEVLGGDEMIENYSSEEIYLVNGLGSLPAKSRRWSIAEYYRDKGYKFKTIIHPSAIVAADAVLSEGAQVMAGVVIQPGVSIGNDSIINTRVSIDHDCSIGEQCHLAPGVILCGDVRVGNKVYLGSGSTVVQGVTVGAKSIIGASSVVLRDVNECVKIIQVRNEETRIIEGV